MRMQGRAFAIPVAFGLLLDLCGLPRVYTAHREMRQISAEGSLYRATERCAS